MNVLYFLILTVPQFATALVANRENVIAVTRTNRRKYYTDCGTWGWSTCTRYRTGYYISYECRSGYRSTDNIACPHAICNGLINPTNACNERYSTTHIIYSDGTLQYSGRGTCNRPQICSNCIEGFFASGNKCLMCTAIANCDLEACTTASDQTCSRCNGIYVDASAYIVSQPDKRTCIQACSWRSDSTSCFPGTCDQGFASNCRCLDGFSGTHCRTINSPPEISYNEITVEWSGLVPKTAPRDTGAGSEDEPEWTNIKDPSTISYIFKSSYKPGQPPPKPSYITGYSVGVVEAQATFELERDGQINKTVHRTCSGVSELSPENFILVCEETLDSNDLLVSPVVNEDILRFTFEARSGGFVTILDKDNDVNNTHYYSGKTRTHTFKLGFDFVDPHHCSVDPTSACSDNMLSVPKTSTELPFTVEWNGWLDNIGIGHYKLEITELTLKDHLDPTSKLEAKSVISLPFETVPAGQHSVDISLSEAGLYWLIMSVFDKAGNHKSARRVFIYDATSEVEPIANTFFRPTTAASEAEYLWQWTTDSVSILWTNRYTNTLHHHNKWLNGVVDLQDVESEYDDHGFSMGIDRIDNVLGIVEYTTAFLVDHNGGSTITSPHPDAQFHSQGLNQQQTIAPQLEDGDTVRFWIRAYDIRREFLEEEVTVHIDTSPPVIENLWLTRGDRLNISVHNVRELEELTIEWESFDEHSGLETITWRLFDNFTGQDILHGTDRIAAQGLTSDLEECRNRYGDYARGANCYCTPGQGCYHRHFQVEPSKIDSSLSHGGVFTDKHRGVHDSDYFFEVEVMNHAKLYTKLDFKITVDTSAPHPGIVHDGKAGEVEIDHQISRTLDAHWEGFFDKESGVFFHQYKFGETCFGADDFGLDLTEIEVTESYSTHAQWTAPGPGKYHVTVVAYNRALDPSVPVCSDGVVVDETAPDLSQIAVTNARIVPGLVTTPDGDVWYIDAQRRRSMIRNANADCRSKAAAMELGTFLVFPLKFHTNGTEEKQDENICRDVEALTPLFHDTLFLAKEHEIYVNWSSTDSESGIYDFEVGLMSDVSAQDSPDILPFTSTHHHLEFHGFHLDISEGERFFIAVKSINKAGLETTKVIGPVIVHTRRPEFTGSITTSLSVNGDYLLADWGQAEIEDPTFEYLLYEVALGEKPYDYRFLPYQPVRGGDSCRLGSPPTCSAIHLSHLPWKFHNGHAYYISLKLTNVVGLTTVVVSQSYVHDVQLPNKGVVLDTSPPEEQQFFSTSVLDDSDFQTSTITLIGRWYGFGDDSLNVTYKVGIGSRSGQVDIRSFEDAGVELQHTFTGLNLKLFKKYFFVVIATSRGGEVSASSDGVTIIKNNAVIAGARVFDGVACTKTTAEAGSWTPDHSDTNYGNDPCSVDLQYQKSTSAFSAYWEVPQEYKQRYPESQWRMEKKLPHSDDIWHKEVDFQNIGRADHITNEVTDLEPGHTYRAVVRLCTGAVCTQPLNSDGVTIIHNLPVSGGMNLTYTESQEGSEITVDMDRFYDPNVPVMAEAYNIVDRYEWSLTDNSDQKKLLTEWTTVQSAVYEDTESRITFKINFPDHLKFSKCRKLSVRGHNVVGLYTIISKEIRDCTAFDPLLIEPNRILDAVGTKRKDGSGQRIELDQNEAWPHDDVDYTPYSNILSAVWPSLRHRNYTWAVVSPQGLSPIAHLKNKEIMTVTDPCSSPDVIFCGQTDKEFINIEFDESQSLHHGRRYYVCVHADARPADFEKWTEDLLEINECSDGVTVDLTPPAGGRVYIGDQTGKEYQISRTELDVFWDQFTDIEEDGFATHASGIAHYSIALGSEQGTGDIISYVDVGLVNHVTFNKLHLDDGLRVFANVTGTDFVGKSVSVLSEGILIDASPPERTHLQIRSPGRYIQDNWDSLCWNGVLNDPHSGMAKYEVSVGSFPGYDDLVALYTTTAQCFDIDTPSVPDGTSIYVTIKGFNLAGLSTTVTSRAFVIDTSPPTTGNVYDGLVQTVEAEAKDKDYATSVSEMGCYWEGFYDPHSSISHYLLKIGTCSGCEDVIEEFSVGARSEMTFDHGPFVPGTKYYCGITACNMDGLCSEGASDGIILDTTAPVKGNVLDGTKHEDIQFQASRTFLGAKWYGFTDAESLLHHYEWRVGTTPGGDDILSSRHNALEEIAFHVLPSSSKLPVGIKIYSTVRAYNKAGLYVDQSSNGVIIDNTAPVVINTPRISGSFGSIVPNSFITRTTLKVSWELEDEESHIEQQYLSLSSHKRGEFNSSIIKVPGLLREYTFSKLELHDGAFYNVKAIACNMAGLCSSSVSKDLLMDSTKPNTGAWAVKTDHAAKLSRHQIDWMTWENQNLNLAWLGFFDLQSGIDHYKVTVGSEEFATDLNAGDGHIAVPHSPAGVDMDDEGLVQTATVSTKDLSPHNSVFISIWAVNGVGLESNALHSELLLGSGGQLELVRRCDSYNCQGHCVCGVQDKTCAGRTGCLQVDTDQITVTDIVDLTFSSEEDVDFSPADTFLAAKWSLKPGHQVQYFDISIGDSDADAPEGVFNSQNDRVWFDAGRQTTAVVTLTEGQVLLSGHDYSFFVRAWYNSSSYSIAKSDGVRIDTSTLQTTDKLGISVKETLDSTKDVDFQTDRERIAVDWKNKFILGGSDILKYRLYICTSLGGHSLFKSSDMTTTSFTASQLNLESGTTYYSTVLAYSKAGMVTWANSDGVQLDTEPPLDGKVYDGPGTTDIDYQSSSVISASWFGFTDSDSSITHYFWCVGEKDDDTDCNILGWQNVGLHMSATKSVTSLKSGTKLWNKVYAVDAVGHRSNVAVSDGVMIDTSAPQAVGSVLLDTNVVLNPSFEDVVSSLESDDCNISPPGDWQTDPDACATVITPNGPTAKHDSSYLALSGSIQQNIRNLETGRTYRLQFHVGYPDLLSEREVHIEGFASIGEEHFTFRLDPDMCKERCASGIYSFIMWNTFTYSFVAKEETSTLKIGTARRSMKMVVDDVRLQKINILESSQTDESEDHILTHALWFSHWSSLHTSWHFRDDESPIVNYKWAIGLVKGGTQIQQFQNVGHHTQGTVSGLKLTHETKLYVTVLATNAAGLTTMSYSEPIIADMTPPVFQYVKDGIAIEGEEDATFIALDKMSVNWDVADAESGITRCHWAIGSIKGQNDIQEFESLPQGQFTAAVDLRSSDAKAGMKVYTTIRCFNKAGLSSSASSDGVVLMSSSEDLSLSGFEVLGEKRNVHTDPDICHPVPYGFRLQWDGSTAQILQVHIKSGNIFYHEDISTEFPYSYSNLCGFNMSGNTEVSLVLFDYLDTKRDEIIKSIDSLRKPPTLTATPFTSSVSNDGNIAVSWADTFTSEWNSLSFEVDIGTVEGGSNILEKASTRNTDMTAKIQERFFKDISEIVVSVTAFDPCGLSTHHTEQIYKTT